MSRRLRSAAFVLLLATAPPAFAQLNSRPAAITLVAHLESLSVTVPLVQHRAEPFAITTSWAVPANLTTVSVFAWTLAPQRLSTGADQSLWTAQVRSPLFAQTAVTDAFTSRVDAVPTGMPTSDQRASPPSGALVIVAQAF